MLPCSLAVAADAAAVVSAAVVAGLAAFKIRESYSLTFPSPMPSPSSHSTILLLLLLFLMHLSRNSRDWPVRGVSVLIFGGIVSNHWAMEPLSVHVGFWVSVLFRSAFLLFAWRARS